MGLKVCRVLSRSHIHPRRIKSDHSGIESAKNGTSRVKLALLIKSDHSGIESAYVVYISLINVEAIKSDHSGIESQNSQNPVQQTRRIKSDHSGIER